MTAKQEMVFLGRYFALRQDARRADDSSSGFLDKAKKFFSPTKPEGPREEIEVKIIRELADKDYMRILEWFSHPEVQGHLDPLPQLPEDWNNEDQVRSAILKLHEYYINFGEPGKIAAIVAANIKDKALGAATIRWRGDPWLPRGHKIASIERLIVNPRIQGRGIGSKLSDEAERITFVERDYPEIRAWVFTDRQAGEDRGGRNLRFFTKRGYEILRGENYRWSDYAKKRDLGENSENREALWLSLKREVWEERERARQTEPIQPELLPSDSQVST